MGPPPPPPIQKQGNSQIGTAVRFSEIIGGNQSNWPVSLAGDHRVIVYDSIKYSKNIKEGTSWRRFFQRKKWTYAPRISWVFETYDNLLLRKFFVLPMRTVGPSYCEKSFFQMKTFLCYFFPHRIPLSVQFPLSPTVCECIYPAVHLSSGSLFKFPIAAHRPLTLRKQLRQNSWT